MTQPGNIAAVLDRPKAVALGSALPEGVGACRDGRGRATPPWPARAACREFRHFRLAATISFYISEYVLSYCCSAASAPAAAVGLRWTAARWIVRRGPARRRGDILDLVVSGHACEAIAATLTLRVKPPTSEKSVVSTPARASFTCKLRRAPRGRKRDRKWRPSRSNHAEADRLSVPPDQRVCRSRRTATIVVLAGEALRAKPPRQFVKCAVCTTVLKRV
jgi:hypothetical protein